MNKKILITVVIIYVAVTSAYFIYKFFPAIEKFFSEVTVQNAAEQTTPQIRDEDKDECETYAVGHIVGDEFRVETRFIRANGIEYVDESDLQASIYKNSCDRSGQTALMYYDSKPIALASVSNYDYSKPFGDRSEMSPIVYTILKAEKRLAAIPDNGYVIAVYDYDENNMDFYKDVQTEMNKEDEDLIAGSCNTIYYQVIGKEPEKVETEYNAVKTELDRNGTKILSVMANWVDPALPKGVYYVAIFNLHRKKGVGSTRYPIFPITKVRKSSFHLFQIVDVDNDGYKETFIRKERDGIDSFTMYHYDKTKDAYIDQSGE
ncbi:MAG: hypothetical protein V1647_04930 [Pseudomonadota bacterium]